MSEKLWGKRKATLIVSIIIATALASIGGFYYYSMHNIFVYSIMIAEDRIIASDRQGLYRNGIGGVSNSSDEAFLY